MVSKVDKIRHSTAHLLAQAVKQLWPGVKLGVGPVIENGFYYDFLKKEPFTQEDLKKISKKMKELARKGMEIKKVKLNKSEQEKYFKNEPFKKELNEDIESEGGQATFYSQDEFVDLCKGPHVESSKELKYFALTKVSGAYWKGDSKNKQLQRIYGVAFEKKEELKEHLQMLENANKFNHRKIGEDMELFTLFPEIGKGLVVWLPKGEIIKREIEKFAIDIEEKHGYKRVDTPLLGKKELFLKTGHLPYYEDTMYPPMKLDDGEYYLKPMNCAAHHLIFGRKVRSYRELPLRIAEYGTVYRNELSGTLTGLQRVRGMCMNDAHIYCTKEGMEEEIVKILKMLEKYYDAFGLKEYEVRLSLWDPDNKEKFIDEPKNWKFAEEVLRKILKRLKIKYVEEKGEAAFYGPKIDVQFKNIYGREETVSTVQLDFAAKSRFELHYDDAQGQQNPDVFVIHRAPLSTHERFMAFLIEHYKGRFPMWLSPVQVKIVTVTERNNEFAEKVAVQMRDRGIRVEVDLRNESIGKKVRQSIVEKVNYVLTIGDSEVEKGCVAVRDREGKVQQDVKVDAFIKRVVDEIRKKC